MASGSGRYIRDPPNTYHPHVRDGDDDGGIGLQVCAGGLTA